MPERRFSRRTLLAAASVACCLPAFACAADAKPEDEQETIVLVSGEKEKKEHVRPQVLLAADRLPAGRDLRFAVILDIEPGWHINTNPARPEFAVPTTIAVKSKHGTKAGEIAFPKGRDLSIEGYDQPVSVYEGRVVLFGTLNVAKEAARQTEELTVEIKFQACNEKLCLAPKTTKLIGKIPVAAQGEPVKTINEKFFEQDRKRRQAQREATRR